MPRNALHNRRGFFSDYWLGSMLARRETAAPKLTAARLERLLDRIGDLQDRVAGSEASDLTRFRERFARPFLQEVLGYAIAEPDERTADHPRFRFLQPEGVSAATPGLPALVLCPATSDLDDAATRQQAERLLDEQRIEYALLVSPETLRLIRRRGHGARGASFDVSLATILAERDRASLDIARRLLHCGNFVPDATGGTVIAALEAESLRHRAQVSASLKDAVFRAAEVVVRGFIEDHDRRRAEWTNTPSLSELRDNALLVLYRLLFILYAESRDERLQTHALYRRTYSIEALVDRLLRAPAETWARNRFELWSLLSATFRIFDEGLPAMPGFENIPPRGGPLFSPDAPGARWISRLRLCDADVADLILALAATDPRRGVGRERISYRELAIEQLGSVYEGLLEFEPRLADQVLFDIRVQGREFVLAPAELVRLAHDKDLHVHGPEELLADPLLAGLHGVAGEDLDDEELTDGADEEEPESAEPESEDEGELKAKARGKLLRRLEPGDFYFAPGAARKSSGSYYTRDEIVQYLTRHALAGKIEQATPDEILRLRVIDLACGSAHFLVGAARYLGTALLAAYRRQSDDPPPAFHPGRMPGEAVRRDWEQEGEAWCKRRVVEQCLYGVDLNPTAVQLAQVALWIESLAGDRPLSFFAHHVRCGNSLLGSSLENLDRPPVPDLPGGAVSGAALFVRPVRDAIQRALTARNLIDHPLPPEIRPDSPEEYRYKNDRLRDAEEAVARARVLFDLRCAAAFVPAIWQDWVTLLGATDPAAWAQLQPWWPVFEAVRARERFFHWELEFPELFHGTRRGFDVVLGNPPWEKVKPDRKEFYARADVLIRAYAGGALDVRIRELHAARPELEGEFAAYEDRLKAIAACLVKGGDYTWHEAVVNGKRTGGDPDLFKFFVDRAWQLLSDGGRFGYLIPGGIYSSEGCTGLRHLLLDRMHVTTFVAFNNGKKIFNIHSSYKFVCLAAERRPETASTETDSNFTAAFMRQDIEELEKGLPAGVQVLIRRDELAALSPGTLAFLEYRTERDREIVLKMYGRGPGLTPRPLLGDTGGESWNVRYGAEFHMTNARGLWTKPDGSLWTPREICGLNWPSDPAISFATVRAAMAREGYWPLYEGKHIDQWLVDTKPVVRWLSLESHRGEHDGAEPEPGRKLVFREIARNTDERTAFAAVLPERSCANNKLPTLRSQHASVDILCSVINSVCFDWLLRFRVNSTINFTYIARVALPRLADLAGLQALETQSAAGTTRWAGRSAKDRVARANDPGEFERLWAVERAVAEAYGLNADDFAHLLASFPVMARKRAAYTAFIQSMLSSW